MATLTIATDTVYADLEGPSSTALTIAAGSKAITAPTGKAWLKGMPLMVAAQGTKLHTTLNCTVTSYDKVTGALVVNVTRWGANGITVGLVCSMWGRFAKQAASNTSVAIGTGAKTFATRPGLDLVPGDPIRAVRRDSQGNWMDGTVTTYNNATGALVMNAATTGGSGTVTDWIFVSSGTISSWVIAPSDADAIVIASGANLTVDATPYSVPGYVQCSTIGQMTVANASPTDPVLFRLSSRANTGNNGKFIFQNSGSFVTRGGSDRHHAGQRGLARLYVRPGVGRHGDADVR